MWGEVLEMVEEQRLFKPALALFHSASDSFHFDRFWCSPGDQTIFCEPCFLYFPLIDVRRGSPSVWSWWRSRGSSSLPSRSFIKPQTAIRWGGKGLVVATTLFIFLSFSVTFVIAFTVHYFISIRRGFSPFSSLHSTLPTELRWTVLNYTVPCWATLHP